MRFAPGLLLVCAACTSGSGMLRGWHPPLSVPSITSDLTRDQQIDHALSRVTYGARPGDVQRVRSLGLERWIALQLVPDRIDDRRADSLLATYHGLNTPTTELTALFREVQQARRQAQRDSNPAMQPQSRRDGPARQLQVTLLQVSSAKVLRATVSERQLYEQMVDFWENHFSVFSGKGQT